jgi:hypothetical protein
MRFPLLQRIDIDRSSGTKQFFVNSCYGVDFMSTRDRTTPDGGLWTFKRCVEEDPDFRYNTRDGLRPHLAHVFGQADMVVKTVSFCHVSPRTPPTPCTRPPDPLCVSNARTTSAVATKCYIALKSTKCAIPSMVTRNTQFVPFFRYIYIYRDIYSHFHFRVARLSHLGSRPS